MGITFDGGVGNESRNGTAFDDQLYGNGGNDTLSGLGGADGIDGGSGNDSLSGGAGNDLLVGGVGADTLDGGDGNDDLVTDGNAGDVLDGGAGEDALSIQQYVHDRIAGLTGIEAVRTNGFVIQGTNAGNLFDLGGLIVADFDGVGMEGLDGADTLIGTVENDNLDGGTGNDSLVGGEGNDTLVGGAGADTLVGGAGNDTLSGGGGAGDVLDGGAGEDTLVIVQFAHDRIAGLTGIEAVRTNGFVIQGTNAGNLLDLGGLIVADFEGVGMEGLDGADTLIGTVENDNLDGGTGNDSLVGGEGNDTLVIVQFAHDRIAGLTGIEAVRTNGFVIQGTNAGNLLDLGGLIVADFEGVGMEGLDGADTLIGTVENDNLDGGTGADLLRGGDGNDTLIGGTDGDTLDGGAGADSLSGGAGNDLFILDLAGDAILDSGGADTVQASIGVTLGAGIEALVLTGAALDGTGNGSGNLVLGNALGNLLNGGGGNDTVDGREGADTLVGGVGNDSLLGGEGADSLNGAVGADTMAGGAGDDSYVVDTLADGVVEGAGGGTDTVFTALAHTLGANVENLVLTGTDAVAGTGNGMANAITGNNAANLLVGGGGHDSLSGLSGADTLNGGAGADTMAGGAGSDRYIVDSLLDVLVELPGEGIDQVIASVSFTLADAFESLQLGGAGDLTGIGNGEANRLSGNAGANLLVGLGGADNLLGGDGADTLDGGEGRDALAGGAGADWFLFAAPLDGPDRIADFAPGQDLIVLAASAFGGLPAGAVAAGNFVAHASNATTAPAGTAQFIYHTGLGVLSFDADGAGGTAAVRLAALVGAPTLTAADLLLA